MPGELSVPDRLYAVWVDSGVYGRVLFSCFIDYGDALHCSEGIARNGSKGVKVVEYWRADSQVWPAME